MDRFTNVKEYAEYLKKHGINPNEKHTITIKVTELELNAIEDLLFTWLTEKEREVLEEIAKKVWIKMVSNLKVIKPCQ